MPGAAELSVSDDLEFQRLVEAQVDEILRARGGQAFMPEHLDKLENLDAQVNAMLQDRSLGRILNGPLWLSGASVVNGTVTADKLVVNTLEAITTNSGNINVTGNLTAASSYPALTGARVVVSAAGVKGYNASDAETFNLLVDGSGFIGIGSSKVSWNTSGVVTVPAAAIGSLTIADVGSGTFNNNFDAGTGRVRAGTALQRVELTSSGLLAYDTAGTNTFTLSASDGSLSHTGVHTIRNSATGARLELSNVGLRGYNSGGTQTFGISTSDGSGFFGAGTAVTWNSSGTVVLDGSLLVAGTVTAGKLNVSTLSAISANMGTITAGTISAGTVSASTLTTGTITFGSGGTINSTGAIAGTLGGINLASLTVTGNITLGSGGKIVDADGSEWSQTGIILKSGGSLGDTILWQTSGSSIGSIYSTSSNLFVEGYSGKGVYVLSGGAAGMEASTSAVTLFRAGSATAGIFSNDVTMQLGDTGGTYRFKVATSGGTEVFGVNTLGDLVRPISNDSTALGAYYGRVPIYINGSLKYLGVYS